VVEAFSEDRPGDFVNSRTNSLVLHWWAGSKEIQSLVQHDRDAETGKQTLARARSAFPI
jgi:hypothetical protein